MALRIFRGLLLAVTLLTVALNLPQAAETVNDQLLMAKKPARYLSEYGLFLDKPARIPNARVISYDLNNPLFTDYAQKLRYIYMPENSAPAPYNESDVIEFPVGSVLIKTFAYPRDFRSPDKDISFIETRLLIHKKEGWKAYPYVWNADQSDAKLKVAGKRIPVSVIWEDGSKGTVDYAVPNMNQCKGCHVNALKEFAPIGPKVRNLNRIHHSDAGQRHNQIAYLRDLGFIGGGPDKASEMPKVPEPFTISDGNLFDRSRSYLDGNCAHCHSPGRPADTSGLYLNFEENREVHWGVNKPPVAAGRGSGGHLVDIKPGRPDQSILLFRMQSTDPGIMMPELGRSLIHKEGIELIEKFIKALD